MRTYRYAVAPLLVALLLAAMSGVAGAQPPWRCGPVTVSIEDGPGAGAARKAVRQLADATGHEWPVVAAGAQVAITWERPTLDGHPVAGASGLAVLAGDDEMRTAHVMIAPDVPTRWLMYTLLHELGHVAGLDHGDERESVMGGGAIPYRYYPAFDRAALAAVACL